MKLKIYKTCLTVAILMLSLLAKSQQSYVKNRWDVKIGYAKTIEGYLHFNNQVITCKLGNIVAEANYGLTELVTIGLYTGYSKQITTIEDSNNPGYSRRVNYHTPFLGLKTNFHIFPLFIKHYDFRFDLYLTGKAGGYYFKKPYFEYNVGAGFAFYPGKHFGLFTEYTFGNLWVNNYYLRYGVVVKFNQ